jgi:hypothetical protein
VTTSFQGGDHGASVNLDVVDLLDAIHEVSRLVNRHLARSTARLLDDLDCSLQDHVEENPRSPHVAGRDRAHVAPAAKCVYLAPAQPWEGDIVLGWHVPVMTNLSRCDGSRPRLLEFSVQRRRADAQFVRRLGAVAS